MPGCYTTRSKTPARATAPSPSGSGVADIVRDCTDTSEEAPAGEKEPWLLRKTRYLSALAHKPENSLLVTAADKAHNARDMVLHEQTQLSHGLNWQGGSHYRGSIRAQALSDQGSSQVAAHLPM